MGNKLNSAKPKAIKIIFLDVDGVLNSLEGSPVDAIPDLIASQDPTSNIQDLLHVLEDDKLKLLKQIVERTKSEIVISSTWRNNARQLQRLNRKLKEFGMETIGSTIQSIESNENRTIEIEMFLNEFSARNGLSVTKWIAIDDMNLMDYDAALMEV